MSTERTYTILIDPEPDGSAYNVSVPALPGVFTFARSSASSMVAPKVKTPGSAGTLTL